MIKKCILNRKIISPNSTTNNLNNDVISVSKKNSNNTHKINYLLKKPATYQTKFHFLFGNTMLDYW